MGYGMYPKNICKIVTQDTSGQLIPKQFILESDVQTMRYGSTNPSNRMVLITRKSGKFEIDNNKYGCTAGDVIVFFQNERYRFEGEEGFQYIYIDFDGMRAEELFLKFGINRSNRIFSGFDGLIPLWTESISRASDENIDLAAESMLLYTFSKFTVSTSKTDNWVNRVLEITENEFSDPQLSISSIAARLSYNPKYLSNGFKKKTGMGYTEYLQAVRIKYAVSLFEHGVDSIKNVALLSGFADPLYFSTVFKKKIGVSPRGYVKNLSENE